jgi:hypothetical protein
MPESPFHGTATRTLILIAMGSRFSGTGSSLTGRAKRSARQAQASVARRQAERSTTQSGDNSRDAIAARPRDVAPNLAKPTVIILKNCGARIRSRETSNATPGGRIKSLRAKGAVTARESPTE